MDLRSYLKSIGYKVFDEYYINKEFVLVTTKIENDFSSLGHSSKFYIHPEKELQFMYGLYYYGFPPTLIYPIIKVKYSLNGKDFINEDGYVHIENPNITEYSKRKDKYILKDLNQISLLKYSGEEIYNSILENNVLNIGEL